MTQRASRLTALLGIIETTYGTLATGWGATDAVLCVEPPTIDFEQENVARNLVLPWMGSSEEIPGRSRARVKFKTELVGSGVAGTPPAWGRWLRACGFSETIVAGVCVKYTTVSEGFDSVSMRFHKSGARYTSQGARGNVALKLDGYGIPLLEFDMMGYNNQPVAASQPSIDLSAYVDPQVVNTANSGSFKMDPTLEASGALSGGTAIPFSSLSWNLNNKLVHRSVVDAEGIAIGDHAVTGKTVVALEAAAEVAWWNEVMAVTNRGFGFTHGTTAGKKITVHAPRVQRLSPSHVDDQGFLMQGYNLKAMPGKTGTPELTIVAW